MADFIQFFEEQLDTDCLFSVQDEEDQKIIKCHKIILSASSPVFKTLFYGSMPPTAAVKITDYSFVAFEKFIKIFYGYEAIIESNEEAFELYAVSHKYMFQPGMKLSIDYMKNNISTGDNVKEYFKFGVQYNDETIKKICLDKKRKKISDKIKTIKDEKLSYHQIYTFEFGSQPSFTFITPVRNSNRTVESRFSFGSPTIITNEDTEKNEPPIKDVIEESIFKKCDEVRQIDEMDNYVENTIKLVKFLLTQADKVKGCLLKEHDLSNPCIYCTKVEQNNFASNNHEALIYMLPKKRKLNGSS